MNWPSALILIFCEAIACFACWCDPKVTAPGGPVLLLIVTTGLCLSMLIGFYRQDLSSRFPKSSRTRQTAGGDSDQEGLGEVPKDDSVSASAERGPHSAPSGQAASQPIGIGVCGGCLEIRWVFRNPSGPVAKCAQCLAPRES